MATASPLPVSIFDGTQNQAIRNADIRLAGRDMYIYPQPASFGLVAGVEGIMARLAQVIWNRKQFLNRLFTVATGPPVAEESSPDTPPGPPSEAIPYKDDISVTRADQAWEGSGRVSKFETYVRHMLGFQKGLPCADPRPQGPASRRVGVVLGDVGVYTCEDGFRKLFNIWGHQGKIRAFHGGSYHPPTRISSLEEDYICEGQVFASGISSKRVRMPNSQKVESYEFTCTSQEGAVLVASSSADRETLANPLALKGFISEHAEAICMYANQIKTLDVDESIYIVTGTIKNDDWALAGYKSDKIQSSTLILKGTFGESAPSYFWENEGTDSYACAGPDSRAKSYCKGKNQCLFLQGFKLAFSLRVWLRMNGLRSGEIKGDQKLGSMIISCEGADSPSDEATPGVNQNLDDQPNRPESHNAHGTGGTSSSSQNWETEELGDTSNATHSSNTLSGSVYQEVDQGYPAEYQDPYDIINLMLLESEADFALTHDVDWTSLLEGRVWNDATCSYLVSEIVKSKRVSITGRTATYTDISASQLNPTDYAIISIDSTCLKSTNSVQIPTRQNIALAPIASPPSGSGSASASSGAIEIDVDVETKLNNAIQQLFGPNASPPRTVIYETTEVPKAWIAQASVSLGEEPAKRKIVCNGRALSKREAKDIANKMALDTLCRKFPRLARQP